MLVVIANTLDPYSSDSYRIIYGSNIPQTDVLVALSACALQDGSVWVHKWLVGPVTFCSVLNKTVCLNI